MRILNKIKAAASACVLSLSLVGCSDYLDVSDEMAESLDIEEVFSNPANGTPTCSGVSQSIQVSEETYKAVWLVCGCLCVEKPPSVARDGQK